MTQEKKIKIWLMIFYFFIVLLFILFPTEIIVFIVKVLSGIADFYFKNATIQLVLFKLGITAMLLFGLRLVLRGKYYRLKMRLLTLTKNTYSKGKARFATKKEIKRELLSVKEGQEYHAGFLVGEYQEISILGLPVKWRPFFNFDKLLSREWVENWVYSKDVVIDKTAERLIKARLFKNSLHNIKFNKVPGIVYTNFTQIVTHPMHLIINGVTRSGKTICYLIPQLLYFARIKDEKEKPLVVITDPKGELLRKTAGHMQQGGYVCIKIDLTDIEDSGRFNSFEKVYDIYEQILKANDIYVEDKIDKSKVIPQGSISIAESDGTALREIIEMRKIDMSRVEDELIRLAAPLYPMDTEGQNAIFTQMSNHLFVSLTYFILEDCFVNNKRELFNIYNLFYKQKDLLSITTVNFENEIKYKAALSNFPEHNIAKSYFPSELSDKTFSSTQITFETALKIYGADSVNKITSSSDLSISEFVKGEKPVAFYLIAPDYDTKYHSIVSTFISQVYYEAVSYADKQPNGKLPRRLYYMLEEFGNLTKINGFPNWLTISLGRNVLFAMIVQNIGQFEDIYGEQAKDTILDQAHIKMYLLSNDNKTLKYFSELFGKTTQLHESFSGKNYKEASKTMAEEERDLVSPEELRMNPMAKAYVQMSRMHLAKQWLRPSFLYAEDLEYVKSEELDKNTRLDEIIYG